MLNRALEVDDCPWWLYILWAREVRVLRRAGSSFAPLVDIIEM
jgi:hypothetical protein